MSAAVCAAPLCPASSEDRLIYLLSQAQQIQELLAFLRKLSNSGLLQCVAAAAADASSWPPSITPIPERDGLVCDLVLEGADRAQAARPDPGSASEAGELVLSALQQCIFGAHLRHVPFLKLVCSQSFEQALQAQRACGLLLEAAVSPANCFSLLQLGRRQGLHHVEARALRAALSCFTQAVRLDRAGFESLPEEVLAGVLSSDSLDLDSELVAYMTLAKWVLADRERRLPSFHSLFVRCVRLGCMRRAELFQLDQHPLLSTCPDAMKLVAMSYLELCYGGYPTGMLRGPVRRRLSAHAAPPAEDDTGRLTPLIRTARLLERPGEAAGTLPGEAAAAAAQPAAHALADDGGAPGTGQQQPIVAGDTDMLEASPACAEQQQTVCEPVRQRGEQPGRHRLAEGPECSSGSSQAAFVAGSSCESRAVEEQRGLFPPLPLECTQSPNGRAQPVPVPVEAPEGSCRPSSCRRLRFC